MYTVIAKFWVKQDNQKAFKDLANKLGAISNEEEDVIIYQLHEDTTNPERFATIEVYKEKASHTFHADTPHVKELVPQMCALCAEEPIIEFYAEI